MNIPILLFTYYLVIGFTIIETVKTNKYEDSLYLERLKTDFWFYSQELFMWLPYLILYFIHKENDN